MNTTSYYSPAVIKVFKDVSCTEEVDNNNYVYNLTLGPVDGFNGTDGDMVVQSIYLKNCGDTPATDTYISETGDKENYFKISVRNILLADSYAYIGTLLPQEVLEVQFSSFIPQGSKATEAYLNYTVTYNTTPYYNNKEYIEVQKPTDLKLKYKKLTGSKVQEEYTISDALLKTGSGNTLTVLNADTILSSDMKTPVRIFHGAKDEIYWDKQNNKYKVRLLCSKCNQWTQWYDLSTFNYQQEITCSKCSTKIRVASNVNFAEDTQFIDKLTKYKIPVEESKWVFNSVNNLYSIAFKNLGDTKAINAYRKKDNTFIKILLNIKIVEDYLVIESIAPFSGYLLVLKEEEIPTSAFSTKIGKSYGKGNYGKYLYGQEDFIHIKDYLEIDIPIQGQSNVMLTADYKIITKYTGEEANIEDIQSYYTDRYMCLGCYDGPALPLKLN